jgi:hypothetical protein
MLSGGGASAVNNDLIMISEFQRNGSVIRPSKATSKASHRPGNEFQQAPEAQFISRSAMNNLNTCPGLNAIPIQEDQKTCYLPGEESSYNKKSRRNVGALEEYKASLQLTH